MKVDNDNNITELDDLSKIQTPHWIAQIESVGYLNMLHWNSRLVKYGKPFERCFSRVIKVLQKGVLIQYTHKPKPDFIWLADFIALWTPATQSELDELAIKEIIE